MSMQLWLVGTLGNNRLGLFSHNLIREQNSFQSATSLVNAEVSVKELVLRRRKSVVLQCPQNRRRSQSSPHSISTSQKESSSSVVCSRCGSTLLAIATAVKDHVGNCNYNISAQIAPEGSRLCHWGKVIWRKNFLRHKSTCLEALRVEEYECQECGVRWKRSYFYKHLKVCRKSIYVECRGCCLVFESNSRFLKREVICSECDMKECDIGTAKSKSSLTDGKKCLQFKTESQVLSWCQKHVFLSNRIRNAANKITDVQDWKKGLPAT